MHVQAPAGSKTRYTELRTDLLIDLLRARGVHACYTLYVCVCVGVYAASQVDLAAESECI